MAAGAADVSDVVGLVVELEVVDVTLDVVELNKVEVDKVELDEVELVVLLELEGSVILKVSLTATGAVSPS